MEDSNKKNPCNGCNALCCRSVAIQWDVPTEPADWEKLKWLVAHKNVTVYLDHDGDWLVEFETDCRYLDKNNQCVIYDKRGDMCRNYDPVECIRYGEDKFYEILFKTPEEIDKHLLGLKHH